MSIKIFPLFFSIASIAFLIMFSKAQKIRILSPFILIFLFLFKANFILYFFETLFSKYIFNYFINLIKSISANFILEPIFENLSVTSEILEASFFKAIKISA